MSSRFFSPTHVAVMVFFNSLDHYESDIAVVPFSDQDIDEMIRVHPTFLENLEKKYGKRHKLTTEEVFDMLESDVKETHISFGKLYTMEEFARKMMARDREVWIR